MASTPVAFRSPLIRLRSTATPGVALAAAALGGSLVMALALRPVGAREIDHAGTEGLDLLGLLLVALSAAPVMAWRRAPLSIFAVAASASVLLAGLGYPVGFPLGATAALYLLAASRDEAGPWTGKASATVVGLLGAYLVATATAKDTFPGIELFHVGLAWSAAWLAGERARLRRQQVADLKDRAARAEREAERERRLAVAEERARIARDLHDAAGHAINVIAIRAGAARLRHHQEPQRSVAALEAIEDLARQTAGEIDRFVGVLRHADADGTEVEVPPGLASLDTLVAQHRASGLDVTLERRGEPRQMSAGADQAAFRILQEAMTNAARHGAGGARVELAFGDEAFEVGVTNPLPATSSSDDGGGHGLVGMRERATLLGGGLVVERSDDDFSVRARLPYEARPA